MLHMLTSEQQRSYSVGWDDAMTCRSLSVLYFHIIPEITRENHSGRIQLGSPDGSTELFWQVSRNASFIERFH